MLLLVINFHQHVTDTNEMCSVHCRYIDAHTTAIKVWLTNHHIRLNRNPIDISKAIRVYEIEHEHQIFIYSTCFLLHCTNLYYYFLLIKYRWFLPFFCSIIKDDAICFKWLCKPDLNKKHRKLLSLKQLKERHTAA